MIVFYTLSLSQRLGLLTCSGLLIGLFAYLSQLKTRWIVKVWITRAAITQGSDHSWLRLFLVCIGDALANDPVLHVGVWECAAAILSLLPADYSRPAITMGDSRII